MPRFGFQCEIFTLGFTDNFSLSITPGKRFWITWMIISFDVRHESWYRRASLWGRISETWSDQQTETNSRCRPSGLDTKQILAQRCCCQKRNDKFDFNKGLDRNLMGINYSNCDIISDVLRQKQNKELCRLKSERRGWLVWSCESSRRSCRFF